MYSFAVTTEEPIGRVSVAMVVPDVPNGVFDACTE